MYDSSDTAQEHPLWYMLITTHPTRGNFQEMVIAGRYATAEDEYAAYEDFAHERFDSQPGVIWEIVSRYDYDQNVQRLGGMYFRNAFFHIPGDNAQQAGGAGVNMEFARAIFRHHIRQVREPLLNALDVEYMKAHEAGEDTADIIARKKVLRDLPNDTNIKRAQTAAELLATWPTEHLGERDETSRGLPSQGYYESPETY